MSDAKSTEDLEALVAMLDKYSPDVTEMAEAGEIPFAASTRALRTPRQR
jgi:hypothetical protein